MTVKLLALSGYGINCEEETLQAFAHVGASANMIHINDLIENPNILDAYQILAFPGGFSYGDDTGSGNAFAAKIRHRLGDALTRFVARDTLTLGICNGCQILSRLQLVPGAEAAAEGHAVALEHNASGRYQCRWVDVAVPKSASPWLKGIERMHIPVAHGEGNFVMREETLRFAQDNHLIAMRYVKPDGSAAAGEFPYNPNGAMDDIAGMLDVSGRVLALMPHPERGMFFTQRDDWPLLKEQYRRRGEPLPVEADGMALFRNAVAYFA